MQQTSPSVPSMGQPASSLFSCETIQIRSVLAVPVLNNSKSQTVNSVDPPLTCWSCLHLFHSSNKSKREPDVCCLLMSCDDDDVADLPLPLTVRALKEHLVAAGITWPEDRRRVSLCSGLDTAVNEPIRELHHGGLCGYVVLDF